MNLTQLKAELRLLVDDSSFEENLTFYLNEAYLFATNEVNIPSLKRMATVTTTAENWVTLSSVANFGGKLLKLAGPSTITVYESLEALFDEYSDNGALKNEAGSVEAVALEGSVLWYQKIPATPETLTVIYLSDPVLLEHDTDVPAALPAVTHMDLLVYGAAALINDRIEDGVDGFKVNTAACLQRRMAGLNSLRRWVAERRKNVIRSAWTV